MTDPTRRFSNRVDDYVQARPSYPPAAIDLLAAACGLVSGAAVADVGAGTGILTRLLLDRGARVFAVEPNEAMRQAAEAALGGRAGFTSVAATAEATALPDRSVDLITAGQAFHWFALAPTRREWLRILRPGGQVALIWNERRAAGTPFLEDYERLLQAYGTDYAAVNHRGVKADAIQAFFGAAPVRRASFAYAQTLDLEGLERRVRSSSYTPAPGQPGHDAMIAALRALFDARQAGGLVRIDYDTTVWYGPLAAEEAG